MVVLNAVHAASGSPPVHATYLSWSSWANPPMVGVAGLWVTVGDTPGPGDILLVVAADGVGLPKSASSDEAVSSSSMGSEGTKEISISSISSLSDSVEHWGYARASVVVGLYNQSR